MGQESWFDGKPVLEFEHQTDRRSFLRWAGLVGVGAGLAVGGGFVASSAASGSPMPHNYGGGSNASDVSILNYALTLEYLEADFYARVVRSGKLAGRELALVTPIAAHEAAHVAGITALITQLGGKPVAKPKITYPAHLFDNRASILTNAATFEELGVVAYHGQVPLIKSVDVLGAAASIAGVESRHAAVLHTLTHGDPFPRPIEDHKPKAYVLKRVAPFLGGK